MLHKFNYYFLQYLFLRLAKKVDDKGKHTGWTILQVHPWSGYNGVPYRYWTLFNFDNVVIGLCILFLLGIIAGIIFFPKYTAWGLLALVLFLVYHIVRFLRKFKVF